MILTLNIQITFILSADSQKNFTGKNAMEQFQNINV